MSPDVPPDGKFDVIGRLDGPLETLGVQIPAKTDEAGTDTPDSAGLR